MLSVNLNIGSEETKEKKNFVSTRNACKTCTPLGACVVFKGIEGCIPLIHGSQGCATYIRRYLISHYKEPVDIASSNFSEESTIFGGARNFIQGINNIISQYNPKVIGIASTCLSETIGEDVPSLISEYTRQSKLDEMPAFIYASTPSYNGSHIDGFHEACYAAVKTYAKKSLSNPHINIFPGFLSPEDLRLIKDMMKAFQLPFIMLPDYSDTLDNPNWDEYQKISPGGTSIESIIQMGSSKATIELGSVYNAGINQNRINKKHKQITSGEYLEQKFEIPNYRLPYPIGIRNTDQWVDLLKKLSGNDLNEDLKKERGRLLDSYVDGHKYVFGIKTVVYGEEDMVIALTSFLLEIGIDVILAASGGESNDLENQIELLSGKKVNCANGVDYEYIKTFCENNATELLIGNSKAYYISRELKIPIVRVGFPIHDRMGGQRLLHIGYKGTQQLFDQVCNTIIGFKQDNSPVGYKYM